MRATAEYKAAYRQATLNRIMQTEIRNSYRNHKEIWIDCNRDRYWTEENIESEITRLREGLDDYRFHGMDKRYRGDLAAYHGKHSGPAVICGSGPSLDENIERLRWWKGGILCSESQAITLRRYGVDPAYIVAFDGLNRWGEALEHVDGWNYDATTLVLNVAIEVEFMKNWRGDLIYYRNWDPSVDFYDSVLRNSYDFIGVEVLPFACSLAATLSIASYMGYGPIYLMGADFGWKTGGPNRFTQWEYHDGWQSRGAGSEDGEIQIGEYSTSEMQLYYRNAFLSVAWLEAADLWTFGGGLLDGLVPIADASRVFAGDWNVEREAPETIRERLSIFLAANNQYWLEFSDDAGNRGYKLIDSTLEDQRLRVYLEMLAKHGQHIDIDDAMAKVTRWREAAREAGYIES
jgi:hypothetical protein